MDRYLPNDCYVHILFLSTSTFPRKQAQKGSLTILKLPSWWLADHELKPSDFASDRWGLNSCSTPN